MNSNVLLAACSAICICAILLLEAFNGASSAVGLALLTILISGSAGVWQYRRHGFDPVAVFCLCFLLYDGVLLLRLALLGDDWATLYPMSFGAETYAAAGALCVIAASTVVFTTFVWELTAGKSLRRAGRQEHKAAYAPWFWAGLFSFVVGLVLYVLQWNQFGGYFATVAMSRSDRFQLAADPSALSYPYIPLVVPGIACLCYGAQLSSSKFRLVTFYGVTTVWCVLVLLQGDRRLVLQTLVTIAGILAVLKPRTLRLRMRAWIAVACAYCFFAAFGYTRNCISSMIAGDISLDQAKVEISDSVTSDWFTPEHSEFAGPYLSLLVAVSGQSDKLMGSSYYQSLLTVLPRFMYPGEKPRLVSEQFAQQMHEGAGTVSGWGYNPVAEAYLNFGVFGVVLIFILWSLYFLAIRYIRRCGDLGVLLAAVLLSEAVNVNRIDFRNVYWETTYFVVGLIATSIVAASLKAMYQRLPFHSMAIQPIN